MFQRSSHACLRHPPRVPGEQVRFILAVVEERLQINNRKKSELLDELKREGYDLFPTA